MIITYKYKLYRNKKNKHIHKTIYLAGRAYNHCIALHKRYYRLFGKHLDQYALTRHLTKLKKRPKYAWLKLIPSQALQDIVFRIEKGYQLFFRNLKHGIKTRPPSFRKISKYKSFTLTQAGWKLMGDNKIKIGKHIYKFCRNRDLIGKIKTITVKRDSLNDLYLFFTLEVDSFEEINGFKPQPMTGRMAGCEKMAGFDFGLKTFLTISESIRDRFRTFEKKAPEFFKKELNEIKRANISLSRKVKGSNNWHKAKRVLAKAHKRITDKRLDWFFKFAHELTDSYDVLIFETLNLNGMKRLWGRKISDLAFSIFLQTIKWVAKKKGKIVIFIDRFFPSSKMCSHCGHINKELQLSDRRWRCQNCQEIVDRDENASINILREGAKIYREGASSLDVGDVRPDLIRQSPLISETHTL